MIFVLTGYFSVVAIFFRCKIFAYQSGEFGLTKVVGAMP